MYRGATARRILSLIAATLLAIAASTQQPLGPPAQIEPQRWQDHGEMTWEDYRPVSRSRESM